MDSDGSSTVVLTVANAAWRDAFEALEPLVERIVRAALDQATTTPWLKAGEVSLLLTDDPEIQSLNAAYRARDLPTNVLSFPGLDLIGGKADASPPPGPLLLGDIAISFERLRVEAAEQRKNINDHFAHLLVHGTLHLLGYDHGDLVTAEVMEDLEATILKSLGFAAPYASVVAADGLSLAT
ncbi:MAG: rRNA maturation RNase YbeY [Alphaproteobacteria bacterium]|nr:rRNA maturation RNase YbeY [Alphaproteobacteria bacterium]